MFYFFCRSILSSVLLLSTTLRKIQKIFNHYSPRAHRCRQSTVNRCTYSTYDIRVCIIIWNYEKDTKRKEKESKGGEYHQYFLFFQFSPPATKNHHDPPRPTTTRNDTPRKTSKVEAKVKERDKRRRIIKKDPTHGILSLY